MATGIPYEKALKLVTGTHTYAHDKGMYDTERCLELVGLIRKRVPVKAVKGAYKLVDVDFKSYRKPREISEEYFRDMLWGRRALLSVPSLNYEGGFHMIYWHYDKVYDPSTKKVYTSFDQLRPREIIVFMEK